MLKLSAVFMSTVLAGLAAGKDIANNFPYMHSDLDGFFYARCVPDGDTGTAGKTEIWKVAKPKDELVDSYDWYNRNGVILGWSPIEGKIAVMRLRVGPNEEQALDKKIEFGFYLGGKHLKSYTTQDLLNFGAKSTPDRNSKSNAAGYRAIGCEQVPGTNEYNFVVELSEGTKLSFNILSGELRQNDTKNEHPDFKDCLGKETVPAGLITAYEAFVKCVKERPDDAFEHALPSSVTVSREARSAGKEEYGTDMNVPFLKSTFNPAVAQARRDSEDCFLLRTGTSAIWFVNVKSGWKIYRYIDKPIQ